MLFVLTELIKVCLHAVSPRNRADEPGLQEGAPLVHQTAVASIIILYLRGWDELSIVPPSIIHTCILICHLGDYKPRWRQTDTHTHRVWDGKYRLILFRYFHLWWMEARILPSNKPVCAFRTTNRVMFLVNNNVMVSWHCELLMNPILPVTLL